MLCLATIGIGMSVIFSVLPPVARDMGLADFHVGVSITIGAIAFMFMAPFWGHASDTYGRKRIMSVGFWGQGLSYLLLGLVVVFALQYPPDGAWGVWLILAAMCVTRLVFGMLGSASAPAVTAYMSDISTPAERAGAVGIVMAGFGLGTAIGPVLGAFLLPFGPGVPFFGVAVCLALAGVVVFVFVREPDRGPPSQASVRLSPFDSRISLLCLLQVMLFTTLAGLQLTTGFFVQDTYGFDALETSRGVGWILLVAAVFTLVVQIGVVPRLRWRPVRLIGVGMAFLAVGHFVMVLQPDFAVALMAAGIIGAGFGFSAPAVPAAATLVVEDHERGSVSGLVIAAQSCGFIFGPFLYSGLYELVQAHVLWLSIFLSVVIWVLARRLPALKGAADKLEVL